MAKQWVFSTFQHRISTDCMTSDPHGVGYGPFRSRLIRQEGLPHARHPALSEPGVGREASLSRARL
jgi:hypothetical protein